MSFNFDRRTFLKGAGAVGAASLLAACWQPAAKSPTTPAMALPPAVLLPPTPPALPPEGVHLL
ncbi:twin-arginine translocation signal domain-containing protein [Faecalibacterium duncaniae]|uniref:twin-arginine translocation signal domain-containing protein n=1 Tax=Faecalibacterium duncaniae (strain DSM 17677 / JCM 31915 / A2-165) TaxID=411483 RepID=UPI001FABD553|nr:twin-arginine translocation signal domain-containing protein [Faecalibacterium duncaniae]